MIRRKVQRLEVVVVGFNLRTFFQRISRPRKMLTISLVVFMTMLGAQRPPDAGKVTSIRSSVAPLPQRASGATSQPLRRRDA